MSTTRFVTLELVLVGGERGDLLHVLLWCETLQVRVYQGLAVVKPVGQGKKNVNLQS